MPHNCSICNVTFSKKANYDRHLLSQKHKKRESSCNSMFQCNKCRRYFTTKSNCEAHKKNCIIDTNVSTVENKKINIENSSDLVATLLKTIENRDKQIDELRNKVEMLIEKTSSNNTTNNNTHIENVTQNVFIVNDFGNENTDYLSDKGIAKLMSRNGPYVCIPKLIRSIHFHPKHPENHNIQVTNIGKNYAKIFTDNKWEVRNKNRTIDDLIVTTGVLLREKFEENKSCLSANQKERYNTYENDKTLMKNIKSEVDITLINGTNEIFKK